MNVRKEKSRILTGNDVMKEKKEKIFKEKTLEILFVRKTKKGEILATRPDKFEDLIGLLKNYTIFIYTLSIQKGQFLSIFNNILFLLDRADKNDVFIKNFKHLIYDWATNKITTDEIADNFISFYEALTANHFESKGFSFVANPYKVTQYDKARPNTKNGKFYNIYRKGYEENLGLAFDNEVSLVTAYFKMLINPHCAFYIPNNKYSKNSLRFDIDDKSLSLEEITLLSKATMNALSFNGQVVVLETTKGYQISIYIPVFFVKTFFDKDDYVVSEIFGKKRKVTKAFYAYQFVVKKFIEKFEFLANELYEVKLKIDKFAVEQEKARIWRNFQAHNYNTFSITENDRTTIFDLAGEFEKEEEKKEIVNLFEAKTMSYAGFKQKFYNVYKFSKKYKVNLPAVNLEMVGKFSENAEMFWLTKALTHKFIINYNHLSNFNMLLLELFTAIENDLMFVYGNENVKDVVWDVYDFYLENMTKYLNGQKIARSKTFKKITESLKVIKNAPENKKEKLQQVKIEVEKFVNNKEDKLSVRKLADLVKNVGLDFSKSTIHNYIKNENMDILVEIIDILLEYVIILMNGNKQEQEKAILLLKIADEFQSAVKLMVVMINQGLFLHNEKLKNYFYYNKKE